MSKLQDQQQMSQSQSAQQQQQSNQPPTNQLNTSTNTILPTTSICNPIVDLSSNASNNNQQQENMQQLQQIDLQLQQSLSQQSQQVQQQQLKSSELPQSQPQQIDLSGGSTANNVQNQDQQSKPKTSYDDEETKVKTTDQAQQGGSLLPPTVAQLQNNDSKLTQILDPNYVLSQLKPSSESVGQSQSPLSPQFQPSKPFISQSQFVQQSQQSMRIPRHYHNQIMYPSFQPNQMKGQLGFPNQYSQLLKPQLNLNQFQLSDDMLANKLQFSNNQVPTLQNLQLPNSQLKMISDQALLNSQLAQSLLLQQQSAQKILAQNQQNQKKSDNNKKKSKSSKRSKNRRHSKSYSSDSSSCSYSSSISSSNSYYGFDDDNKVREVIRYYDCQPYQYCMFCHKKCKPPIFQMKLMHGALYERVNYLREQYLNKLQPNKNYRQSFSRDYSSCEDREYNHYRNRDRRGRKKESRERSKRIRGNEKNSQRSASYSSQQSRPGSSNSRNNSRNSKYQRKNYTKTTNEKQKRKECRSPSSSASQEKQSQKASSRKNSSSSSSSSKEKSVSQSSSHKEVANTISTLQSVPQQDAQFEYQLLDQQQPIQIQQDPVQNQQIEINPQLDPKEIYQFTKYDEMVKEIEKDLKQQIKQKEDKEQAEKLTRELNERYKLTIIVSCIPNRYKNHRVTSCFKYYGINFFDVRDCKIIKSSQESKFIGKVHLEFKNYEAYKQGLFLNNKPFFNGKQLRDKEIMKAQPYLEVRKKYQKIILQKMFKLINQQELDKKSGPQIVMVSGLVKSLSCVTEGELKNLFETIGKIDFVKIEKEQGGNECTGNAFLQFRRVQDAYVAVQKMNMFQWQDQQIRVSIFSQILIQMQFIQRKFMKEQKRLRLEMQKRNEWTDVNWPIIELNQRKILMLGRLIKNKLHLDDLIKTEEYQLGLQDTTKKDKATEICEQIASQINIAKPIQSFQPTNYLLVFNMFNEVDVGKDQNFLVDLEADLKQECQKYGQVVQIIINKKNLSAGQILIQFASIQSAQLCLAEFQQRQYNSRQLNCYFASEMTFIQEKAKILAK